MIDQRLHTARDTPKRVSAVRPIATESFGHKRAGRLLSSARLAGRGHCSCVPVMCVKTTLVPLTFATTAVRRNDTEYDGVIPYAVATELLLFRETQRSRSMAVYKQPKSKNWWYKFTWNGDVIRESTKQTNKRAAVMCPNS